MGRGATTRGATFTTMPLLAEVVLPPAMPSALAHLKGGAFEPVDGVGSRSLGQQPKHDTVGALRCGQMHCGGEGRGGGEGEEDTVGALRSGQMHCRGEGGERKGEAGGNVGRDHLSHAPLARARRCEDCLSGRKVCAIEGAARGRGGVHADSPDQWCLVRYSSCSPALLSLLPPVSPPASPPLPASNLPSPTPLIMLPPVSPPRRSGPSAHTDREPAASGKGGQVEEDKGLGRGGQVEGQSSQSNSLGVLLS